MGQTADKAIDGAAIGLPVDATREWASNGQTAGAWIQLTWTQPVTLDHVVLYDRPNLTDQIVGATLRFDDGTTITVPALDNDGTATLVTFPARTTTTLRLTVIGTSATTLSVGLAEFEAWGRLA